MRGTAMTGMQRGFGGLLAGVLALNLLLLGGCAAENAEQRQEPPVALPTTAVEIQGGLVAEQTPDGADGEIQGGLVAEQILDGADGEIHYSYSLPENYNPALTYPLVMAMPGYGEMWFGEDSSGRNLNWSGFLNWTELDEPMIVVSAQLTDWGEKSARQAVELTEYFLANFAVDKNRVYAAGYSAGGETMSRAVSMRPDLYAAYLHAASQWDGTYAPLAEQRVAVYLFMGENDEYYGSQKARDAYDGLLAAYREAGVTEEEIGELLILNIPDDAWFNERGVYNYHGGGNLVFDDLDVLNWIAGHSKESKTMTDTGPRLGDLPAEYAYGDWSYDLMNKKLPEPADDQTVLNTAADPTDIQVLYLWEEGNVPAVTSFTPNMTGYFDDWDFRPYVTAIPVREGVTPRGAVVLMAGGAYQFRGNYTDSLPVADALRELGFVTFIVDYRLRPYNQEEGALDVARAVRWIRKNADAYGIDPDNIAVMGFSAGGIQAGEFLMHYDGDVNGTALDPDYVPDELDAIPAYASACGMIYAFYGRLSVGNMDPDWLREGDLPPTFYCYGTEDPFYRQFEQQYAVLEGMGHPVDRMVLQNWPHGFGAAGGWVETYARWLDDVWSGSAV